MSKPNLDKIYTPKQQDIYRRCVNDDWFMLINHGAKRSGKTVLNNDLFIQELLHVRQIADKFRIDTPQYILAGATLGTIQQNILTELTNKYGIQFTFDKLNNFTLFGVYVIQCGHSTIGHLGKIRGMTAFGAYVNEGSLANPEVFDEIKSRCSGPGARMLTDTNPDNPEHWLLKDYIQNKDSSILSYGFELDDNTFLDERYRRNIKNTTPSGMFYDRNIKGLWVSGEGVVYQDFDKNVHTITRDELKEIKLDRYFAGLDWGYQHFGAIVVFGMDGEDNVYLIEEHAYQHKEIDFWVETARGIKARYGNIHFYCDSARPEYVMRFGKEKFKAINADKSVLSGIEAVATLIKQKRFYVLYDETSRFRDEIYKYAWNDKTGEPIKESDDVMDAIRYGIYTASKLKRLSLEKK
ncbi:PBSX family phage terminase large subunit [Lysinibacillus sp.]|uniref:PBSX family phage terminase large subunit n=1 Tax=Lysinibacillus sp. TaxID=1869345 RepID=UPI0028971A1D|nr:PBSX family phage terminase large subunit [Lysinibacillus sp.]